LSSDASDIKLGQLDRQKLPTHVAIIMDGNGRWAKRRMLNRIRGHEKGADAVRTVVRTSRQLGISILTLYAFSTENWQRPKVEVSALMMLLKKFLVSEQKELLDNNIRLNAIGHIASLPEDVQASLAETMTLTRQNDGMLLNLALSYGGRAEIIKMVREIAADVKDGKIEPDQIDSNLISNHLYTRTMADPDLLIRPSGEFRISNFLLWQIAYAEIFVTDTLWPDFDRAEYIDILLAFQQRERRFGLV